MRMTTIYKCDTCGQEFKSAKECRICEASHMNPVDKIKYMIMLECKEVCDYCDHSYYVYGCERDCEYPNCTYDNNHKDFVPVEPLDNKRISGV